MYKRYKVLSFQDPYSKKIYFSIEFKNFNHKFRKINNNSIDKEKMAHKNPWNQRSKYPPSRIVILTDTPE